MVVNAALDAGAASRTTCHWDSPVSETPAGCAETTPGVPSMAAVTASDRSVEAITFVGSVTPPGKWAARVWNPVTESALTRNWSISASPTGRVITAVASTANARIDAAATRPAW